jgi:hypothetical protein
MADMRKVSPDFGATEGVSEADALEQQLEAVPLPEGAVLEETDIAQGRREGWDADAIDPDDERVVTLDDDTYR